MSLDLAAYNDAWLVAWSDKDVPALLGVYAEDVTYIDPQVPSGVRGHDALAAYLTQLFASTPPMRYVADQIWPSADGYFGRWYCELGGQNATLARLRHRRSARRPHRLQRGLHPHYRGLAPRSQHLGAAAHRTAGTSRA